MVMTNEEMQTIEDADIDSDFEDIADILDD